VRIGGDLPACQGNPAPDEISTWFAPVDLRAEIEATRLQRAV